MGMAVVICPSHKTSLKKSDLSHTDQNEKNFCYNATTDNLYMFQMDHVQGRHRCRRHRVLHTLEERD